MTAPEPSGRPHQRFARDLLHLDPTRRSRAAFPKPARTPATTPPWSIDSSAAGSPSPAQPSPGCGWGGRSWRGGGAPPPRGGRAPRESGNRGRAGAPGIVADPSVAVGEELLDGVGDGLRVVANYAVGYDNVALEACRSRGIAVTNTPGVLTNATAELALALTLAAARRLGEAEGELR